MKRTFTVELTEAEAVTVWRMAALSGIPAAQIVRNLHRYPLFRGVVSFATDSSEDPAGQAAAFKGLAVDLLGMLGLIEEAWHEVPDEP